MVTDTYAHGFDADRKLIAQEMDAGFFSKIGAADAAKPVEPEIVAQLKQLLAQHPELAEELLKKEP